MILREIYREGGDVRTIFIVLPGVDTLDPASWTDDKDKNWLQTIGTAATPGLIIYTFDHDLIQEGILSWERVETEGARLMNEIESLLKDASYATSPIILIAHSLGGIVLKRAICYAYNQQRSQRVLKRVAGTIFVSCPHSLSSDNENWQHVGLILKKFSSKARWRQETSAELAKDCQCFERAFNEKPVISIHEELPTPIRKLWSHKRILVPESFAHPTVHNGIKIGVKSDHSKACCLASDQNAATVVKAFLRREVSNARQQLGIDSPVEDQSEVLQARGESEIAENSSQVHSTLNNAARRLEIYAPSSSHGPETEGYRLRDVSPSSAPARVPRKSVGSSDASRKDAYFTCFAVPYPENEKFHGRKEILLQVSAALIPSATENYHDSAPSRLRSFALSGPGGIGKSQIAAKFAHDSRDSFDAILWIHADNLGKLRRSLARIAVMLGLVEENSTDAQDETGTQELVLGWLARPLRGNEDHGNSQAPIATWLLILDNIDDPNLLKECWPVSSAGSVLITSRIPLHELQFDKGVLGVTVPEFDANETANFLLKITSRTECEEDRQAVPNVAKILGGIPLAVTQMAGFIVRRDITFAEFLQDYQEPESQAVLLKESSTHGTQGYNHNLLSVWGFEKLRHSARLLEVLAFLDPDDIPEDLLEDNDAIVDLEGFPMSKSEYIEARAELMKSSLVSRDRSAKKLVIHRLVQDTVRAKMTDGIHNTIYNTVFISTLQLLSSRWPYEEEFGSIEDETTRRRECSEIYKHVLFLRRLYTPLEAPKSIWNAYIEPPKLVLEAAWLSVLRADYSDTEPLLDMAWTLCEPLQPGRKFSSEPNSSIRQEVAELLRMFHFHRGALAHHTNKPQMALDNCTKYHDLLQESLGDIQDQRIAIALNELGVAHLQNHNAKRSEACLRKSIDILHSLGKVDANTMSMPLINLGFALWVQEEYDEAEQTFQQALRYREAAYGVGDKKSFALGKLLLGYGNVKAYQGNLDESYKLHKRCLDQYRLTVGPSHHRTADGHVHVADHHIRQQRYNEAADHLEKAARIFEAQEYFKPEYARVCYKLWQLSSRTQLFEKAKRYPTLTLDLYRAILPTDSRQLEDLSDADFDKQIMFWSR